MGIDIVFNIFHWSVRLLSMKAALQKCMIGVPI